MLLLALLLAGCANEDAMLSTRLSTNLATGTGTHLAGAAAADDTLQQQLGAALRYHWEVPRANAAGMTLAGTDSNFIADLLERIGGGTGNMVQTDAAKRPTYCASCTPNGEPATILHVVAANLAAVVAVAAANRVAVYVYGLIPNGGYLPDPNGIYLTRSSNGATAHTLIARKEGSDHHRIAANFTGGLQDLDVTDPLVGAAGTWRLYAIRPSAAGAVAQTDGVTTTPDFTGNDTMAAANAASIGHASSAFNGGAVAFYAFVDDSDANDAIVRAYISSRYETAPSVSTVAVGGWGANTMPSSIRTTSNGNKTHWGSQDTAGKVYANQYNEDTGELSRFELYDSTAFELHRTPAFLERASDGRLLVFYSSGGGASFAGMSVRISTNPGDSSAWGAAVNLATSLAGGFDYYYPKPVQMADGTIYLWWRNTPGGLTQPTHFSTSTDGGVTWAAGTVAIENADGDRPYVYLIRNGASRIDLFFTSGHPLTTSPNALYHAYFDHAAGKFYKSDGTEIGAAPIDVTDGTLIYDGSGGAAVNVDLAIDAGKPVSLTQRCVSRNQIDYYYNRWNGSAWVSTLIVSTQPSAPFYEQSILAGYGTIDSADPYAVYLTRKVSGAIEIYKYVTADAGATFGAGTALTSGSRYPNTNPRSPRNRGSALELVWFNGPLTDYQATAGVAAKSYPERW